MEAPGCVYARALRWRAACQSQGHGSRDQAVNAAYGPILCQFPAAGGIGEDNRVADVPTHDRMPLVAESLLQNRGFDRGKSRRTVAPTLTPFLQIDGHTFVGKDALEFMDAPSIIGAGLDLVVGDQLGQSTNDETLIDCAAGTDLE